MGRTKGSGSGSVYKRGDKWRGQITVNGRRYSHTAKKKSEVLDWLAEIRNSGGLDVKPNITVEELAKEWLKQRAKEITPQTLLRIEKSFGKHLYPILGKYEVKDLTRQIIQEAYPKMFEPEKYAKQTVILFKSRLKALLDYAVDQEIIEINPHNRIRLDKYNEPNKIDAYTAEDQKKIVAYLKQRFDSPYALLYILLATGMREGEAAALTWDDVDMVKGELKISKTIVTVTGATEVQHHPKTAAGVRTIHLSKSTLVYLRKYKRTHNSSEYIFLNTRGGFFDSCRLGKYWTKACNEMGIERKRIHSLRHTYATRALEKGIDVKTVSKILGHTNVTTTMNIYQDVLTEQKKKTAEIMNDLF